MGSLRTRYLMEIAWDYIVNGDMFEDFIEEYDLDMTEEEMNYFQFRTSQKAYMEDEGRITR